MSAEDAPYRIVSLLIFAAGAGISVTHRHRADREGGRVSLAAEPLRYRLPLRGAGLLFLGSYIAWLADPAWVRWAAVALPGEARWAGAAAGAACLPAIWWVFSHLGRNVSPTVLTRKRHTLVTGGPYRWVRHPLYTTGFVAWAGLAVLMGNIMVLAAGLAAFVLLVRRTDIEERYLIARFGARYRAYMARTGRFLPRFR